eukprot:5780438-Prorocentrum_lima.AAC.1
MPRKDSANKVDGTGVLKWKKEVQGQQSWVRVVKAGPTARGFKEMQAYTENMKTCSGSATKWAQRA